jgi:hypothetical protein
MVKYSLITSKIGLRNAHQDRTHYPENATHNLVQDNVASNGDKMEERDEDRSSTYVMCMAKDCSEPRDRLYALSSLAVNKDLKIASDHRKSIGQVYTTFATKYLEQDDISILGHAGMQQRTMVQQASDPRDWQITKRKTHGTSQVPRMIRIALREAFQLVFEISV